MFKVELMGYIGNDAVTRLLDGGNTVTEFSIAWNPNTKDKDAKPIWVRCNIWGDYGSKSAQHLTKGSAVIVYGTLQEPKTYTDKNGVVNIQTSVYVKEWLFTPSRKDSQPIASQMAETNRATNDAAGKYTTVHESDDLPF